MSLGALWNFRWMRRLPALIGSADLLPAAGQNAPTFRCSAVVAGRNEGNRIEQCIRCLLAQRGVELELIVVDDRSSDRTPEILRQLAAEDARLKAIRVDALPEVGWANATRAMLGQALPQAIGFFSPMPIVG